MKCISRLMICVCLLLPASQIKADTFADEFSVQSYSNQDGTENWSTDWIEQSDDGNPGSPSNFNDIGIIGGRLFLKDRRNTIRRKLDLSGYTRATLSFDYEEVNFDNFFDWISIQIRSASGNWRTLRTFFGSNIGSGSYSVDISSYISNATRIRFRTGFFLGNYDYFYVDNVTILAENTNINHIAITHDGNGVSCVAENITFAFHDPNHQVLSSYTGSITVDARDVDTDLTSGSWTPANVANPGSFVDHGDGTFTYLVTAADNGSFTASYVQNAEATINFDAVSGSLTESSEDDDLVIAATFSNEGNFRDEFTGTGGNFTDTFETISYSNNDGNLTWSTSWIETEQYFGDSPFFGDVRITNGRLELTGNNTSGFSFIKSSIEREVDLSGVTNATLRFTMRTTSVESNDIATVAISSNGGLTWTTLGSYNDDISSWQPFSFDITPYMSANTRVRFRIEDEPGGFCCFGPSDEILQVEDIQILVNPTGTYSNNDGSLNFAGDWIESDGTGPTNGEVSIYLHALYMYGNPSEVVSISRAMDLSSYNDAILTFDYEAIGNVDPSDKVDIEANNGTGWVLLETLSGPVSGQANISLQNFMSSNTQIRFVIDDPGTGGSCCYNASDEVFKIDNVDITVFNISSCKGADHFSIAHSGSGINCEAEPVTITAKDSSGNTVVDYTGTISINTSTDHGDWSLSSGYGLFNPIGSDAGAAEYTFNAADNGQLIVNLFNTHAETLSVDVEDQAGITETSHGATPVDDPSLTFASAGFKFIYGTGAPPSSETIPLQTAGRPMAQGLGYEPLKLRAIDTDLDTAECTTLFSGNQSIELALECLDPNACSNLTGSDFIVSSTSLPENNASNVSSYTNVTLTFDGTGTATLNNAVYNDAGRVRLHARLQQVGDNILGSSQNMDFMPAGFCVTSPDTNSACAGPSYWNCTAFKKAGELFNINVSAQGWQTDGDSNFCDNNFLLPSFSSTVNLSPQLVSPAGGNTGLLNLASVPLANGVYAGQLFWSEVGAITLQAGSNSYLSGALPTSHSDTIGRFVPYEFFIIASDDGTFSNGQTGFTYIGQEDASGNGAIGYTTQPWFEFIARDANGNTIQNYLTGSFFKTPAPSYNTTTATLGSDVATPLNLSVGFNTPSYTYDAGNHKYRLTLDSADHFKFDKDSNALVGPFVNDIQIELDSLTDSDSITAVNDVTLSPTGGPVRYGQMQIINAYGPETEALNQIWQAQYFDGNDFVLNTLDSDTTIDSTNLISGSIVITDVGDSSDPLQTTDSTISGAISLIQGEGELTWSAPLGNRYGSFEFDYNISEWLEYDWSSSGDEDPTGSVSFGLYRGHDKVIYWKEITY